MRGLRPLFAVAATLLLASSAGATEMVEIPTPPPPPPQLCCVAVEAPPPRARPSLLFDVLAGPSYRRAFSEDWAGALLEVEVGGQNDSFGMGARFSATLGASRGGLPFQLFTLGPAASFRLSPRLRIAIGATFGIFAYDRVTYAGQVVWGVTAGANAGLTVDLVRTERGGAMYLLGRVSYDYVESLADTNGSTIGLVAALGYRY